MAVNEIILTADGSHSMRSAKFGVDYHSKHGAIQESQHVFIEKGLHHILAKKSDSISILEVGMGTGLNVLLTALEVIDQSVEVKFTTLEAYPIDQSAIASLNYASQISHPQAAAIFKSIHNSDWESEVRLLPNFSLRKQKIFFADFQSAPQYDVIYFDAFAPTSQPELWTTEALAPFVASLQSGGILTTYCAKGVVRRSFEELGGVAERLPGPPGKREMLRILKP